MAPARNSKPYARPRRSDGVWSHDRAALSSGPAARTAGSEPSMKLIVSNLHYEITPKNLMSIFGQIGTLVCEPQIRYDRSGRSSGVAIVTYETIGEATRAKNQFQGLLAKGQPMEIASHVDAPRRTRSASMPGVSTASLLNRIEKPSLVDRLNPTDNKKQQQGAGPVRNARGGGRGPRGGGKTRAARPSKSKPKTAEDLDKELDVFMGDDKASSVGATAGTSVGDPAEKPVGSTEDVAMA
ncbi:hypothetical protein CONPUDRAFT_108567 [Coniophora puteana RWD-64-598 SS2]|uniref:RRM domain-containing protein n=1 Tax=Coniophora puteana (strain RWD-64-598) TaxID=741705 RepID=A0A5M3MHA4_CONPW|nr:uncharacterized protein CONPUDRAFT_108567 [Coniophora puteana RWD-64-598 SS2]EIW78609.1 hypothetical protein CONPUDRAFT_108567 [Coniophora puteana RWD-64-598 SS2]